MVQLSLLVLVVLVCSEIMLQCSSNAAPVLDPLESEAGGAGHERLTESFNTEEEQGEKQSLREVRSVQPGKTHDYALTSIKLLSSEWRPSKCNNSFNCGTVSNHWCSYGTLKKLYCAQGNYVSTPNHCEVTFQIVVDNLGATVEGLDISLYKLPEEEDTFYYVYIIYLRKMRNTHILDVASSRVIDSSCSSWQTFHIDIVRNNLDFSTVYERNITLTIAIFKGTSQKLLSCDEISSLFVLDKTTVLTPPPSTEQPITVVTEDGKKPVDYYEGSAADYIDLSYHEEGGEGEEDSKKKEEIGSGEDKDSEQQQPYVTYDEESKSQSSNEVSGGQEKSEAAQQLDSEILVPIVTAFVSGDDFFIPPYFWRPRGKREVKDKDDDGTSLQTVAPEAALSCELHDRLTTFDNPTILAPTDYIQHVCVTPPSLSDIGLQCVPSTYQSIYVIISINNRLSIELLSDLIVSGCETVTVTTTPPAPPSCEVQDKVVILAEYYNVPLLAPHSSNIRQCNLSSTNGEDTEGFRCVPDTYQPLWATWYTNNGSISYQVFTNVIVNSCKLITDEIDDHGMTTSTNSEGYITTTTTNKPHEKEAEKENTEDLEGEGPTQSIGENEQEYENSATCELRDKLLNLQEYGNGTIVAPSQANVRECVLSPSSMSSDSLQCVPSTYGTLDVIVRIRDNTVVVIETLTNLVVSSCKVIAISHEDGKDSSKGVDQDPEEASQ